jgi:hypothetical protein
MPANLSTSAQWEDTLPTSSTATGVLADIRRLWPVVLGSGPALTDAVQRPSGYAIVADAEGFPAISDTPGEVDDFSAVRHGDGTLILYGS